MISFELLAVLTLVILAFGDLIVGVVNDAVNFLNSAIGSKVTSRKVILIVASIGIIIGTTFSDGIIEVARKGIFHPEFFSATEVITIFAAVALSDIILLDLYSTFGLPTSTTVSIVFELLGAAFIFALLKVGNMEQAWEAINSASAMKIVVGIVLSIGIAFFSGLIVQFFTRLIFTFNYKPRIKKWGAVWSGVALTSLLFFILMKGAKHATFMTNDIKEFINGHTLEILLSTFVTLSVISYGLIKKNVNILKVIVLIGTASLAMAFAGNDLANFIGVSIAGTSAFLGADLTGELPTPTWVLLLAGIIMIVAIWRSKKAKTVSATEINIASHEKHIKSMWKTNVLTQKFIDLSIFIFKTITYPIPESIKAWISKRWKTTKETNENGAAFDLVRASVNLMVAAAVISYATSQKLPLSTTYVTFMVAMGTSLADGVWNRDCAPSRISGVLTVISGWFLTAIVAFLLSGVIVGILFFGKTYGLIAAILFVGFTIYKLSHLHDKREKTAKMKA